MALRDRLRQAVSRVQQAASRVTSSIRNVFRPTRPGVHPANESPTKPRQPEHVTTNAFVRDKEFDMRVDDDPAFMAWVNRVGAHLGAPILENKSLTDSRLQYLIDYYGCADALELYEKVNREKGFGYKGFQQAYAADGKNRDADAWRYTDDALVSMMQYSDMMLQGEMYEI